MEAEDEKKMIENCGELVKAINWPEIWPKLFEHGIYLAEDKKVKKWEENLNNLNNNRDIYLTITKRGPEAFTSFLRCLKEIGRNDLANILRPDDSVDQVDNNHTNDIIPQVNGNMNGERQIEPIRDVKDNHYKHIQKIETPFEVVVKKATKFMDLTSNGLPCYTMRSNPRGLVLIINNIVFTAAVDDRLAAEYDEKNLNDLYEQMGFDVQISHNLTCQEMLKRIETFSKQPDLRHVHSIFVIIMSHGNEHVVDNLSQCVVIGKDNLPITEMEILNFFTTAACPDMYHKPKVFIFQTCRGKRKQLAINPSNVSLGRDATDTNLFLSPAESQMPANARNFADVLVAYSTLPGHVAYRDNYTGSWYIQTLCEVFMNHAHNMELTRMLQETDSRLAWMQNGEGSCQTSVISNFGFNKKFYFNPGYFED